jgi:hypothetical protein
MTIHEIYDAYYVELNVLYRFCDEHDEFSDIDDMAEWLCKYDTISSQFNEYEYYDDDDDDYFGYMYEFLSSIQEDAKCKIRSYKNIISQNKKM